MAAAKEQPKTIELSALELELDNVHAGLRVALPPGVRLTIEGEALERATIAAELRDWIQLFAAHAAAEREHEQREAEWRQLALEARAYAREVRAALDRYLDGQALACTGGREPPTRRYLAAAKLSLTRELREARSARPKETLPGGSLPSQPWAD